MESPSTTQAPVSGDGSASRLSGQMSTTQLVLSVLAFSSPLTCLAGYFSLTIMASGNTAPVAFVLVTAILLIFSVGYMAMTKHMPRPGAFYAYISEGLGRHVGLAAAFLATLSYSVIGMGVYCFAGLTVTDLVAKWGGPEIPWWLGALAFWVIVGILGYFNVDVSAKVLMWVMFVEVTIVMIFNVAIVGQGGESGLHLQPFNVFDFAGGEVWVGLLFAMLVFIGFEATALYRDEVRDPNRTIPRATYLAVLFIGILYTVTVWVMVTAFGSDAQNVATGDAAGMFGIAADRYVGVWFSNVATALVITAVLASILSIHNASTRYLFNLSADGALPLHHCAAGQRRLSRPEDE
ncbi:MAG: APC family permease, partial [Rhodococcus sp. (in: high G+C Gram-positive bacteria)]